MTMNNDKIMTINLDGFTYITSNDIIQEVYPQLVMERLTTGEWMLWQIDNINDIDHRNQRVIVQTNDPRLWKLGVAKLPNTDQQHLRLTLKHVKMVESLMQQLAFKLLDSRTDFALQLVERSRTHDVSKFKSFEFYCLREEHPRFGLALEGHRLNENNRHHPENHKNGIKGMSELDIAEMVCDCTARAQEFGTDVRKWFHEEATVKYNFEEGSEEMEMIDKYLDMILTPPFKTTL